MSDAAYHYRKAQMEIWQQEQVNHIDEELADVIKCAEKTDKNCTRLGDNDTVAPAQLQAEQQQLMIEQNMLMPGATNKQCELGNQLSNEYVANKAQARNSNTLRQVLSQPTGVSDKPVGDF